MNARRKARKRFRGRITIACYHPITGDFLGSHSSEWCPLMAADGFYSKVLYPAQKEIALLAAKAIKKPLFIKKPKVRITWMRSSQREQRNGR